MKIKKGYQLEATMHNHWFHRIGIQHKALQPFPKL